MSAVDREGFVADQAANSIEHIFHQERLGDIGRHAELPHLARELRAILGSKQHHRNRDTA